MNIDRVLVLSLFSGYTLKLLILGAQPADAIVVLVLAAAHFGSAYYNHEKQINELKQEVADVKKQHFDQSQKISEINSTITGIKLSSSLRNVK